MIILPIPKECNFKEEMYAIPEKMGVLSESTRVFNYLSSFCNVSAADNAAITFKQNAELGCEEYTLVIKENKIEIEGGDEQALYRAAQTLKQIFLQAEDNKVPCVEIKDKPDFKKRGIMLDVSRGRIEKPSEIKRVIDIMSDMKYNELQLYFDTVIFEYKSMSKYYNIEDVLTVENIKEIQKYAQERFIELVPNQNSLGHMRGWIRKDEFRSLGITRDDGEISCTINPLLPESLEFVDRLYGDLLPHFSADTVHIGMDETFELGKGETQEAGDKYGVGKLYIDFLKKVCNLATEKYNKRPMFWDDIVMKHSEYIEEIPKNSIVVDWGYEADTAFEKRCRKLKEVGLDYYVAPGTSNWQSITGRGHNMLFNIMTAADSGTRWGALGFLLTDWCDDGGEMPLFMSYIPYAIGGAYSWNSGCSGEEFENNLDEELRIAYRSKILDLARDYTDKFIFKVHGKSFAKILYRINNVYNFEQDIYCNMTQLSRLVKYNVNDKELEGIFPQYFEEIEGYMKKRKADGLKCVLNCDDSDLIRKEFELICDIAIFNAQAIQILAGEYNNRPYCAELTDVEPIIERFKELWKKRNIIAGCELYAGRLADTLKKIERVKASKGGESK